MKVDWVAECFAAMRDCGENISIVFGRTSEGSSKAEPDWFELAHDEYDGISGLTSLLRAQGCRVDKTPVLREDKYSFFRGLRGFFTALPTVGVRHQLWKKFDRTRDISQRLPKERVAWYIFTEEQTENIFLAAKSAKVTVNTYLLFHLDAVVATRLTEPSSSRYWMLPVNLRGAVTRENELTPHMSFLGVEQDEKSSLCQLHERITQLKKRGYHWGTWALFNAGVVVGAAAIREDILKKEKKNHGWTGTFSNLGAWSVAGTSNWIFGPVVTRVHPIGAGCITMNGRLAISIQLHEALEGGDLVVAQKLLDGWKQECLKKNYSEQSEPEQLAAYPV